MTDTNAPLSQACRELAAKTMLSASADVVETVGKAFEDCARTYERRMINAGQTLDALVVVVEFISEALAHTEVSTDVRWFDATLDALLEVIAPSRVAGPASAKFRAAAAVALRDQAR